ncbi:MAG TPA: hypothetical protein VMN36_10955 [Verrucomicrobiales bacterium]|nr:hypothetical protein [Verrucomicrobiales bacterium]
MRTRLAIVLSGLLNALVFAAEPFPSPWTDWITRERDPEIDYLPATEFYEDYNGDGREDTVIVQPKSFRIYQGETRPVPGFVAVILNEGGGQAKEIWSHTTEGGDIVFHLDVDGSPYPDLYIVLRSSVGNSSIVSFGSSVLFADDMVVQRLAIGMPPTGVTKDIDWDGRLDIQMKWGDGTGWRVH